MPLPFSRYQLPISSHTLKEKLLFCVCAIIGVVSELITISNASYLFPHPQAELNYKLSLAVSVALFSSLDLQTYGEKFFTASDFLYSL